MNISEFYDGIKILNGDPSRKELRSVMDCYCRFVISNKIYCKKCIAYNRQICLSKNYWESKNKQDIKIELNELISSLDVCLPSE